MPRRAQSGPRGVVYLDAGFHSVVSILVRRIRGHQIAYLRARSLREERLLKTLGARQVDVASVKQFKVGPRSTEGPIERALPRIQRPDVDAVIEHLARRHQAPHARAILKSAVIAALARHNIDAFYAEAWARSHDWTKTSFVVSLHWQRLLLEGEGASVGGRGDASIAVVVDAGRYIGRRLVAALARSRAPGTVATYSSRRSAATWRPNPEARGPVLFVLNRGLSYGGLYSYDNLLSCDPDSILGVNRVVTMAATGGEANSEGIVWGYPKLGPAPARAWARLRLFVGSLRVAGISSWSTSWLLAGVSARATERTLAVARDLPDVSVAVLAYDLQVPVDVVLALESAGVRTVALNERPLSVVVRSQPLATHTLLTASTWFSDQALDSPSAAVKLALAVGMWRTDFLVRYAGQEPHPIVARARSEQRSVIVALPYHLSDHSSANPLATSCPSVRHFLTDILNVAEKHPEAVVVIRGKDATWLEHHAFSDLVVRSRTLSNVVVSDEYGQFNESYRLVAGADLVIAKYTSLVEEALALSIPCIVHDYTPTARGIARPVVSYLPDEAWVENQDELSMRVEAVLADGGRGYRARWEPQRLKIFGDLADGCVAQRARHEILRLVEQTEREKR